MRVSRHACRVLNLTRRVRNVRFVTHTVSYQLKTKDCSGRPGSTAPRYICLTQSFQRLGAQLGHWISPFGRLGGFPNFARGHCGFPCISGTAAPEGPKVATEAFLKLIGCWWGHNGPLQCPSLPHAACTAKLNQELERKIVPFNGILQLAMKRDSATCTKPGNISATQLQLSHERLVVGARAIEPCDGVSPKEFYPGLGGFRRWPRLIWPAS